MKMVETVKGYDLPQRDREFASYSRAFEDVQRMSLKAGKC